MIFQGPDAPALPQFMAEYWQQKPCLLRRAFPGLVPELDKNDVAGLACEESVESRLITGSYPQHDWRVSYGPFTARELRKLPDSNWTLLVQDAEKHYPALASLMAHFSFLPSWRLDDLMISVAAPGGSVGPHYDQYDVFLLQASGRRRWQIATEFDSVWLADCELRVLASFSPEMEWELEPGDVLYLPPGVAHHGVALDAGMTWSIGLRAPSQADLLLALGEWLAENFEEGLRYTDGAVEDHPRPGEISAQAVQRLAALVSKPLDSAPQFHSFLAGFLTRHRLARSPGPPERAVSETEIAAKLAGPAMLQKNPWTRLAWIEQDGQALLSAAGDEYICSVETAIRLCGHAKSIHPDHPMDAAVLPLLCRLINDGHFLLSA